MDLTKYKPISRSEVESFCEEFANLGGDFVITSYGTMNNGKITQRHTGNVQRMRAIAARKHKESSK